MKEITIDESSSNQRFDRFLRKYFKHTPEIKLGDIFSWIRKGSIKVNSKKKSQNYRLVTGDIVTWDNKITTEKNADTVLKKKSKKIADLDLGIITNHLIHEDENFIVRDKPAHILMHPGDKHITDITLHDIMVSYLTQTGQWNATDTYSPSFCYRLDKDTSGIVISAKTFEALQYLNQAIRERKTKKTYHTVLVGDMKYVKQNIPQYVSKKFITYEPNRISITAPLFVGYNRDSGRSQTFVNPQKGKESRTDLHLIDTKQHPELGSISLVKVKLYTGRMHQIRAHASYIGLPVLGDLTYGVPAVNRKASKNGITRQLLHASGYGFFDKFKDKDTEFTSGLPKEFLDIFGNKY